MRIKEELPQFQDQRTLIVVSGRREAILYLVNNGEIWKKEKIEVEDPEYSDKEGFFKSSSRTGGTMKAGSVYKEKITYNLTREYLDKLEEKIKNFLYKEKIKNVFLFCPDYMKKEILKKTPKEFKDIIHFTKMGNYINSHPFELLEGIQEDQERKKSKVVTPIKAKAQKILKKTAKFNKKNE